MSDEYLWDKTGEPDPEVEHLERILGGARFDREPPEVPHATGRPGLRLAVAAAALLAVGALTFVLALGARDAGHPTGPGWQYALVGVGSQTPGAARRQHTLAVGAWIETDATTRADLAVADIGRVTLEPGSRLRLLKTGEQEHRLRLERGRMEAIVDAPPRLFVTETPAGDAVDLGCRYTLLVDANGHGMLAVQTGMVMYARGGYDVYVPADARCEARKDKGMGTPYFASASDALRAGLRRLDFEADHGSALDDVIAATTRRDTLTLWNLLHHPQLDRDARARVQDRIETFLELPVELTREAILERDGDALLRLRYQLELDW